MTQHNTVKSDAQELREYCYSFYGPDQQYGDFFNHELTERDIRAAVRVLQQLIIPRVNDYHRANPLSDGYIPQLEARADSIQREWVRDIILVAQGADITDCDWGGFKYDQSLIGQLDFNTDIIRSKFEQYYY